MNPELAPSLTTASATFLIVVAVLGMIFTCYCGYRLGKLAKSKPAPKPKTYIKVHALTLEQTIELAGMWDEMDSGKRLAKTKFWQALRTMLPKEDMHESIEIENSNHSQWKVKITKEVVEEATKGPADGGEKTSTVYLGPNEP